VETGLWSGTGLGITGLNPRPREHLSQEKTGWDLNLEPSGLSLFPPYFSKFTRNPPSILVISDREIMVVHL